MLAETTDVTAVQDNNNYYTLQYIHYFVIHTSITRNRNRKPHNKSWISSQLVNSSQQAELSQVTRNAWTANWALACLEPYLASQLAASQAVTSLDTIMMKFKVNFPKHTFDSIIDVDSLNEPFCCEHVNTERGSAWYVLFILSRSVCRSSGMGQFSVTVYCLWSISKHLQRSQLYMHQLIHVPFLQTHCMHVKQRVLSHPSTTTKFTQFCVDAMSVWILLKVVRVFSKLSVKGVPVGLCKGLDLQYNCDTDPMWCTLHNFSFGIRTVLSRFVLYNQ